MKYCSRAVHLLVVIDKNSEVVHHEYRSCIPYPCPRMYLLFCCNCKWLSSAWWRFVVTIEINTNSHQSVQSLTTEALEAGWGVITVYIVFADQF